MFSSHIELGNTASNYMTLAVTIKNLSTDTYLFDEAAYDSSFYSNSNIVPTLSGITDNSTVLKPSGETGDKTSFMITF